MRAFLGGIFLVFQFDRYGEGFFSFQANIVFGHYLKLTHSSWQSPNIVLYLGQMDMAESKKLIKWAYLLTRCFYI